MTDEHVERYGTAWKAGQREDRECGLCGNFIQPGQWMHYHYNADGSRAVEHVDCDRPEEGQNADYLRAIPHAQLSLVWMRQRSGCRMALAV